MNALSVVSLVDSTEINPQLVLKVQVHDNYRFISSYFWSILAFLGPFPTDRLAMSAHKQIMGHFSMFAIFLLLDGQNLLEIHRQLSFQPQIQ